MTLPAEPLPPAPSPDSTPPLADPGAPRFRFLPPVGTWRFHLLLSMVAIFILGPLGGIAASYMNFSLGFFVGGQVLAGILGSAVTYGYGPEGKHGANYMQTMAASVASLCAMSVLIQAMVWLGMPMPPAWKLMLFVGCVGMFGVGGIFTSLWNMFTARSQTARKADTELPSDMSTTSLVGGGLIAGESLYFLLVGLAGLVSLF